MDQHYIVEYVYGKKIEAEGNEIVYATKWLGYDKDEMTWQPLSTFDISSQTLVIRFERANDYKIYHTKIYQWQGNPKLRIHIKGNKSQIFKRFIKPQPTLNLSNILRQQEIQQHLIEEEDQTYVKRGRGRPRKCEMNDDDHYLSKSNYDQFKINKYQQQAVQIIPKNGRYKSEKDYIEELMKQIKFKPKKKEEDYHKIYIQYGFKDFNSGLPNVNFIINLKYFDQFLKYQVSDGLITVETIFSHHYIRNQRQIIFKCEDTQHQICYFDFETLQSFHPILLLDYVYKNSVWRI